MMTYRLVTAKERPDIERVSGALAEVVWPQFLPQDPIVQHYWQFLYTLWPEYQFAIMAEDAMIALGNSVPLYLEDTPGNLPQEGWDWILPKAVEDAGNTLTPNVQVALQVMVPPEYQGQGLSKQAVLGMTSLGRQQGFRDLFVPARPTRKHAYPLIAMADYVRWRDPQGQPFDPWLRVHHTLGATIRNVCQRSMSIRGTVQDWEGWTGMVFPGSGAYVIPGGLVPLAIDAETNEGVYIEPNVWLHHAINGNDAPDRMP